MNDLTIPPTTAYGSLAAMSASRGNLQNQLADMGPREQAEMVASQFEGIFLGYMLKAMRSTVPDGGLLGDSGPHQMFTEMLDQEYVKEASKQWSFGFHDALVRQILGPDFADEDEAVEGVEPADGAESREAID